MTELSKNDQVPQCDKTAVMQSVILPNELRMGNLVGYKFGEDEIYAIRSFDEEHVSLKDNISFDYIGYDEIEPLEITPFILKKLGFYIVSDNEYKTRFDILEDGRFDYILVKHNLSTSAIRFEGSSLFNIKHVHQLQNLYFSLTGRELTVA